MLTNFDHGNDRQWFNTLIPPSHETATVYFVAPSGTAIARLSGSMRLSVRYTTPDIHRTVRRYECDGGINKIHVDERQVRSMEHESTQIMPYAILRPVFRPITIHCCRL